VRREKREEGKGRTGRRERKRERGRGDESQKESGTGRDMNHRKMAKQEAGENVVVNELTGPRMRSQSAGWQGV
jgi:hypothetical protein